MKVTSQIRSPTCVRPTFCPAKPLRLQLHQDPPHAARVTSDGAGVTTPLVDVMDLAILRYHLAMPTRKADARRYPTITRAEAEAWRDLHRQLARTRTLQDAKDIAAQAAPPHAKRFYAHLRSFVRTLKSPRRGTRSELYVYRKLRLRFANGGQPAA